MWSRYNCRGFWGFSSILLVIYIGLVWCDSVSSAMGFLTSPRRPPPPPGLYRRSFIPHARSVKARPPMLPPPKKSPWWAHGGPKPRIPFRGRGGNRKLIHEELNRHGKIFPGFEDQHGRGSGPRKEFIVPSASSTIRFFNPDRNTNSNGNYNVYQGNWRGNLGSTTTSPLVFPSFYNENDNGGFEITTKSTHGSVNNGPRHASIFGHNQHLQETSTRFEGGSVANNANHGRESRGNSQFPTRTPEFNKYRDEQDDIFRPVLNSGFLPPGRENTRVRENNEPTRDSGFIYFDTENEEEDKFRAQNTRSTVGTTTSNLNYEPTNIRHNGGRSTSNFVSSFELSNEKSNLGSERFLPVDAANPPFRRIPENARSIFTPHTEKHRGHNIAAAPRLPINLSPFGNPHPPIVNECRGYECQTRENFGGRLTNTNDFQYEEPKPTKESVTERPLLRPVNTIVPVGRIPNHDIIPKEFSGNNNNNFPKIHHGRNPNIQHFRRDYHTTSTTTTTTPKPIDQDYYYYDYYEDKEIPTRPPPPQQPQSHKYGGFPPFPHHNNRGTHSSTAVQPEEVRKRIITTTTSTTTTTTKRPVTTIRTRPPIKHVNNIVALKEHHHTRDNEQHNRVNDHRIRPVNNNGPSHHHHVNENYNTPFHHVTNNNDNRPFHQINDNIRPTEKPVPSTSTTGRPLYKVNNFSKGLYSHENQEEPGIYGGFVYGGGQNNRPNENNEERRNEDSVGDLGIIEIIEKPRIKPIRLPLPTTATTTTTTTTTTEKPINPRRKLKNTIRKQRRRHRFNSDRGKHVSTTTTTSTEAPVTHRVIPMRPKFKLKRLRESTAPPPEETTNDEDEAGNDENPGLTNRLKKRKRIRGRRRRINPRRKNQQPEEGNDDNNDDNDKLSATKLIVQERPLTTPHSEQRLVLKRPPKLNKLLFASGRSKFRAGTAVTPKIDEDSATVSTTARPIQRFSSKFSSSLSTTTTSNPLETADDVKSQVFLKPKDVINRRKPHRRIPENSASNRLKMWRKNRFGTNSRDHSDEEEKDNDSSANRVHKSEQEPPRNAPSFNGRMKNIFVRRDGRQEKVQSQEIDYIIDDVAPTDDYNQDNERGSQSQANYGSNGPSDGHNNGKEGSNGSTLKSVPMDSSSSSFSLHDIFSTPNFVRPTAVISTSRDEEVSNENRSHRDYVEDDVSMATTWRPGKNTRIRYVNDDATSGQIISDDFRVELAEEENKSGSGSSSTSERILNNSFIERGMRPLLPLQDIFFQ